MSARRNIGCCALALLCWLSLSLPNVVHGQEESVTDDAFYHAAVTGDADTVRQYLGQSGADLTVIDHECPPSTRCNALTFAAEGGHVEVVRLLLEAGVTIDRTEGHGATALLYAHMASQHEVMRLLVQNGADVNHRNRFGASSFMVACALGEAELVELYLAHGAAVGDVFTAFDSDLGQPVANTTALMLAAQSASTEAVRLLLEAGADLSPLDALGRSALDYAAAGGDAEVVALLSDGG